MTRSGKALPHPRGPVLRHRYGVSGLTSNAPFAAEVQSNIEQSCCSIVPVRFRGGPVDPLIYLAFGGIASALIELGRFDKAIVAGKKAQRLNPAYQIPYRCLASAFAHLGRDAEAREAAAQLLEVDPAFTLSSWIARGGQSNSTLMIEGLRKAGLPE